MPNLWKHSVICPVPKNNKPVALNDYRPIALIPIVMKCFERIILKRILSFTTSYHDPYQFAYKPNGSTDDATLTLTPRIHALGTTWFFCSYTVY